MRHSTRKQFASTTKARQEGVCVSIVRCPSVWTRSVVQIAGIAGSLLLFCATVSQAAIFCVNDPVTLREVLRTAASNGQADQIRLREGVYRGRFVYVSVAGSREGALTLEGGYSTGCKARSDSPSNTVLDGRSRFRPLSLNGRSGENFVISGITVQNGSVLAAGGGLNVSTTGELVIDHAVFRNNAARSVDARTGNGGGIKARADSVRITLTTFTENSAEGAGGGAFVEANSVRLTNNVVDDNTAVARGGGVAISAEVEVDLELSRFERNTTDGPGGGIYIGDTPERVTLVRNHILRNSSRGNGGGVAVLGARRVSLEKNVVGANDTVSAGGGIHVDNNVFHVDDDPYDTTQYDDRIGHVSLVDNTIYGNYASAEGGGLLIREATTAQIAGNVVVENDTGTKGGGMYMFSISTINIVNNTIAWNETTYDSGGGVRIYFTTGVGIYNNLFYGNDGYFQGEDLAIHNYERYPRVYHNRLDTSEIHFLWPSGGNFGRGTDPDFVNADVRNYRLGPESPYLDVGDNDAPYLPRYDHDGAPRIVAGIVDLGAFEFPGSSATPSVTLSEATHDFGAVVVGEVSRSQTFKVGNAGDAAFAVGMATSSRPGEYQVRRDNCSKRGVPPSGVCTIDVVFTPSTAGVALATLTIGSDDPSVTAVTAALTGTGVEGAGGSTTNLTNVTVSCRNLTAGGRTVRIDSGDGYWDCIGAGLRASSGDRIRQIVDGELE